MAIFNNAPVLWLNVYSARFRKKETTYVPPRPFHSLTLRLSGSKTLRIEGHTLVSGAPGITYIPKGTGYQSQITEDGQMLVVHFDMAREADGQQPFVFTPSQPLLYKNRFEALYKRQRLGQSPDYGCFSIFCDILDMLSADMEAARQDIPEKIRQALSLIENNFSDPFLSVGALAEQLDISQVYLRRAFKAACGSSPLSHIRQLRLDKAKAMLQTGYYTITEVAEKCGYTNLCYFSASFHKATGMTPSDYISKGKRNPV